MNFALELKKLLDAEDTPPVDPLAELARANAERLKAINKDSAGVSLQIEEIYDIINQTDKNAKEAKNAAKRESLMLGALVAVNDLLDDAMRFIMRDGAAHAGMIAARREQALVACGIELLGVLGERLDPRIHTVALAEFSNAPIESITSVLENGYLYRGEVVRKATVTISKGSE